MHHPAVGLPLACTVSDPWRSTVADCCLQMTALDQLAAVALESELQLQQEEAQARDAQSQAQARAEEPASLSRGPAEHAGGVAGTAAGLEPVLGSGAGQVRCFKNESDNML